MIADFEARLRHGGPDGRLCEGVQLAWCGCEFFRQVRLRGQGCVRVFPGGGLTSFIMRCD